MNKAIIHIFWDEVNRKYHHKGRLMWLVEKYGVEEYRDAVIKEFGLYWRDLKAKRAQPKPMGKFDRRELLGVHQQPQEGKVQVGILVPAGRLSHVECRCIAHISNKYSYREIRLAVEQNGILKAMMVLIVFEKFRVGNFYGTRYI